MWLWSAACSDGGAFPAWGLWVAERGRIRWIEVAIISRFGNEVGRENTAGAVSLQLESISVNLKWPTSAELAFFLKPSHMRLSCKHTPTWKWVFTPSPLSLFLPAYMLPLCPYTKHRSTNSAEAVHHVTCRLPLSAHCTVGKPLVLEVGYSRAFVTLPQGTIHSLWPRGSVELFSVIY